MRRLLFIGAATSLAGTLAAAEPSAGRLRRALDPVVARIEGGSAFCGIEVRSLRSGQTLYSHQAGRAFRPASALKLVTTAVALDVFGPDARFRTTLETTGRQDAFGRILGDLYLVGRGDPSLSPRFGSGRPQGVWDSLADALAAQGVKVIEGRLLGHEGTFAGERRGRDWTWEDLVWSYGAEVSALSWNDNSVELSLLPGERAGDPVRLLAAPFSDLVEVASSAATGPGGSIEELRLEKDAASGRFRLSGRMPPGSRWSGRVAVNDPARFAALALRSTFAARGILVREGVETTSAPLPPAGRVLATHEGATVAEILRVVNKESANLQAELLLRLAGSKLAGDGGIERAREAVLGRLGGLGVPTTGFSLSDGCGLARSNLVTPAGLATLLVAMDRHVSGAAFRDSLPLAGRDGTLEKRLRGTPAEGRIAAKTGQLAQTYALAGYAATLAGDRLAFAILVNNHAGAPGEALAAIDAMAQALVAR